MPDDTRHTDHDASPAASGPTTGWIVGIAELVTALPKMTGIQPSDCLCVVATGPGGTVTSAFSVSLPETPEDLPAVITGLMGVLAGEPANGVILIGYGPQLQVSTVIAAACGALAPSSAEVLDAVRIEDGRYWSYLEEDPAIRSEGIALTPGPLGADSGRGER